MYVVRSVQLPQPIHNNQPNKCAVFFLRYLYFIVTLSISTCFSPQGIIIRE